MAVAEKDVKLETVKNFVERKCEVNSAGSKGETSITRLLSNDRLNKEIIKYLIENKSNLNDKGGAPIIKLFTNQQLSLELVRLFFEKNNGNLFVENARKSSVLHYIMTNEKFFSWQNNEKNYSEIIFREKREKHFLKIVDFLIVHKLDINQKTCNDETPLHLLFENKNLSFNILNFLIENKSEIKVLNKMSKTPIQSICSNQNISIDILKLFLDKKNFAENDFFHDNVIINSLLILLRNNNCNLEMIKLLIDLKIDINQCYTNEEKRLFCKHRVKLSNVFYSSLKNKNSNVEWLKYLNQNKIDPNYYFKFNKKSPISLICKYRDVVPLDMIDYLIDMKTDVNNVSKKKFSSLHFLCKKKILCNDVIERLIEHNADLNIVTSSGCIPLHFLSENKQITAETLKILLKNKSDINLKKKDYFQNTSLHLLVNNPNTSLEVLKLMVEFKCDVNLQNNSNFTPLSLLCLKENISSQKISFLLESKASILSQNNDDSFINACKNNDVSLEIIKSFFDHNKNILGLYETGKTKFFEDDKNNTPFYYFEDREKNVDPLLLVSFNRNIKFEIIEFLIEKKSKINSLRDNITPLLALSCNKNVSYDSLKIFIENKADINYFPIFEKILQKEDFPNIEIVKLFLDHKLDINKINKNNENFLHIFLYKNFSNDIVDLFIESKVSLNEIDNKNNNPLHIFLEGYNKNVDYKNFSYLIEKGLINDFTLKNNKDLTFLDLALKNEDIKNNIHSLMIYLHENNFKFNYNKRYCGKNIVHFYLDGENDFSVEYFENFIKNIKNFNSKVRKNKFTILHSACDNSKNIPSHVFSFLLQHYDTFYDIFCKTTPLHLLVKNDDISIEVLEMFLEKFDINAKGNL